MGASTTPRSVLSFLLAWFGLAPCPALGDLGAALRRSKASGTVALPTTAPLSGSVVIPLEKESVRGGAHAGEVSFYVGQVSVGHPGQDLRVVFDTSSGHVLLPHRACGNATCLEHRRFSPWESSTAMDVGISGHAVEVGRRIARGKGTRDGISLTFTQSDLGEGDVKAVLVRDSVCISGGVAGPNSCVDMAVLAAYRMDERPFRYMPSDGVIGLGLSGLSACPLCNFVDRMLEGSSGVLPQFGLLLDGHRGELHLGGHDMARMAAPVHWFPVDHPEAGFWQVAIKAVRVGNLTVDDCRRGCHGIVDSAVSRLGVQSSKVNAMRSALTSMSHRHGVCHGPDLTFDLGDMSLTLRAQDYGDKDCVPLLGSLNLDEPEFVGVYTFGATVLHRYYAAFDWEQKKVGFAPLITNDSKNSPSATAGSSTPEGASSANALLVF